ncbi:hypothetical protein [Alkalimarinus coralli]|uniref:hypothetical protein n=1 Tax=Alkalimarinus coralli TaxID=2935863 RepID=UPI00202B1671|nr:hypothetical protein [Alkalimarinus coralli]
MSEPLFELAFYGRLVDGVSLDTAKSNVIRLFKASAAQVDKMFAGGRVVIRNKLDKATADKYVAVMRKNGLICEVDPMGQAGQAGQARSKAPSPSAAAAKPSAPEPSAPKPSSTPAPAQAVSGEASKAGDRDDNSDSGDSGGSGDSGLKVLPLASTFSAPESGAGSRPSGFNLAGEDVDGILQQSHLDLDPEGVRLSEHHEVEAPVFSDIDNISIAPAGSDLADKKEELPPIVPDVSSISIAPVGSDMGQLKKDEHIEVPDLSHLKLDDLPDNQ